MTFVEYKRELQPGGRSGRRNRRDGVVACKHRARLRTTMKRRRRNKSKVRAPESKGQKKHVKGEGGQTAKPVTTGGVGHREIQIAQLSWRRTGAKGGLGVALDGARNDQRNCGPLLGFPSM